MDILTGVLDAWKAAGNAHEPERVADVFTEDAIFQGLHPYSVGRNGVAAYYDSQPLGMTADYRFLFGVRIGAFLVLLFGGTQLPLPHHNAFDTELVSARQPGSKHGQIGSGAGEDVLIAGERAGFGPLAERVVTPPSRHAGRAAATPVPATARIERNFTSSPSASQSFLDYCLSSVPPRHVRLAEEHHERGNRKTTVRRVEVHGRLDLFSAEQGQPGIPEQLDDPLLLRRPVLTETGDHVSARQFATGIAVRQQRVRPHRRQPQRPRRPTPTVRLQGIRNADVQRVSPVLDVEELPESVQDRLPPVVPQRVGEEPVVRVLEISIGTAGMLEGLLRPVFHP
ncbi:hypothetical protein [Amycolatopsis kentuckyensis]|uniref:hypothetical protein n=1 Tax=Amycolatopsis kentuckyensis TaxID=218823 RepID=UPI001FC96736|nr:hypothetical protein [Amycolatopsis kentuckyensis]